MSVLPDRPTHDDRQLATLRYLAGVSALAVAYYASAQLGLSLYEVSATALIWFPSAIALAVFVLYGIRYWPAVVLGSLALMVTRGLPLRAELIIIASHVLEPCVGAFLLVRVLRFRPQLDRVRDAMAFACVAFLVTSLMATVTAALFDASDLIPDHLVGKFGSTWWWTHLSGDLVVTPAILTVAHRSRMPRRDRELGLLEAFTLTFASFGIVLAIVARWLPPMMSLSTPPYYVLPMLLWAGLRFGPRGAALACLGTNIVGIVAQELGIGPFESLLDLHSFVTISTLGTLIVSSLALERTRALEASAQALRNARDQLEADVAQRTAQLTAADRHRAQLAQLVESSDDAIIALTPEGIIQTWNFGAREMFGYTAREAIGRSYLDLVTPSERKRGDQVIAAVRGGEHIAHDDAAHVRKNGQVFPASVTTSAVTDSERRVVGISKVIRDITKQQEIQAQLRASLHEKEVLLREIHHRVKNNLQVIASLLRLETSTSERAHQALVDSQNRIHSMAMIHQLLYQSKDFAHVDFQQYLDQLADRLGHAFGSANRIAIRVRCTLGDQLTVDQAIPCALILNELVTNALTHAFPGDRSGSIDIQVSNEGAQVKLVIRDDGIGIPVEDPERLSGMGFRIVRTLALQLHGTLKIERENGTVVTVAFAMDRPVFRGSRRSSLTVTSADPPR